MLTGFEAREAETKYTEMQVDGRTVVLCKLDFFINATQILGLSGKTRGQKNKKAKILRGRCNGAALRPARGIHGKMNTWTSIQCGREFCVELGLEEKLRPLLDEGFRSQRSGAGIGKACDLHFEYPEESNNVREVGKPFLGE